MAERNYEKIVKVFPQSLTSQADNTSRTTNNTLNQEKDNSELNFSNSFFSYNPMIFCTKTNTNGTYKNHKMISTSTIRKIHCKCDCRNGNIVNCKKHPPKILSSAVKIGLGHTIKEGPKVEQKKTKSGLKIHSS